MQSFDLPLPINKIPRQYGFDGVHHVVSLDQSVFREGCHSMLTAGSASTLYGLAGNTSVMKFWLHNVDIDSNGNFLGRDEADSCSLMILTETNKMMYFGAPTAARRTLPVFTLYLTIDMLTGNTTYVGQIIPSQTIGIVGTTTNNNAPAGAFGEIGGASTNLAPALTTNVAANLASLSLTAGDWHVWGVAGFVLAATTTTTVMTRGLNTTTATQPAVGLYAQDASSVALATGAATNYLDCPHQRFSLASTTTVYLVGTCTFAVSTASGVGYIYARRKR